MEFRDFRRILACVRAAADEYGMIGDGDVIAVGLSGGKDSLTLLAALCELRRFYPKKFSVKAITVSMGFDGTDDAPMQKFCDDLGVELKIVSTQLGKVIFEERKEKNPCSLCSRMRRGILHNTAKDLGCSKLALGHHFDDVVETFMLNLFREGRLGTLLPVTYLSRKDITVIRPMLYVPEQDIRLFVGRNPLPVTKNLCPADGETERESIKRFLSGMETKDKGFKLRVFGAIRKGGLLQGGVPAAFPELAANLENSENGRL